MGKTLRVAKELELPIDAVTQKLAMLGRSGSGKTFAAKRLVEQMLRANVQVVILDPVGVWAGLRLGRKSFDVPVLGGLYGDIPLEPTAGAVVADLIVDRGTSMVIDLSQMLDAQRTKFAVAFAGRFFQRKKAAPSAVHLVIEECQEFIPQNTQHGEELMLHEFQRIAKQGRSFGIGLTLISQRPQEVNKKALNQAECVFAFQMTGPQERKALEYWLSDKGFDGKLSDILPRLEIGAPHVWSPSWLKISKIVHILPIDSLDTSATPKVGEKAFAQKKLEPIDLDELQKAMAATIEKAKADDPKALRAKIAELEKRLARPGAAVEPEWVEMPVFDAAEFNRVMDVVKLEHNNLAGALHGARTSIWAALEAYRKLADAKGRRPGVRAKQQASNGIHFEKASAKPTQARPVSNAASDPKLTGRSGLRRIMVALAQRPSGLARKQLGLRAGLSSRSGTFATYLGTARSSGWLVDSVAGLQPTQAGLEALGQFDPLPEGDELFEYWVGEVGASSGAARMLGALKEAYPKELSRDELGERANISARSGTFATYLGKLRGLELIVDGPGGIGLSEELT